MRFALIGCGGIGSIRAGAVAQMSQGSLVAVADVDSSRARTLADAHGAAVELDWRDLATRDDVDAVIVSTPPNLHEDMCSFALVRGKHVLCEKPLARTAAECRAIVDAATRSERLLATGFNYRFYPSMQKARALLQSGIIGDLDHVRSYAGYSARDHNPQWVHDFQVMGGGALRDNGIHLIDLTRWFLGEVAEVKGFASSGVWSFPGCEDNGFALLRGVSGRIAVLQASWTEWRGYKMLIELYGTRGCIRAWCFPMMTEVVWSKELGGRVERKRDYFPRTFLREHLRSYKALVQDSFVAELNAFSRMAVGEKAEAATGLDGLRAIEIAGAASVEDARTVMNGAKSAWGSQ